VGTVAIHIVVGSQTIGPAAAQQLPFSSNRSGVPIPMLQFHIAPGPFDLVLPAFENATELHIVCPIRRPLEIYQGEEWHEVQNQDGKQEEYPEQLADHVSMDGDRNCRCMLGSRH
jgi:hypothetical protein